MYAAPDHLVVEYTSDAARAHVKGRRRQIIGASISLALVLVIWLVVYLVRRDVFQSTPVIWWVVALGAGLSLARLVLAIVRWLLARRDLRRIGSGPALVIGRFGVEANGQRLDWPGVKSIALVRGPLGGLGSDLAIQSQNGAAVQFGLLHLDVEPAALESATRVHSGGSRRMDLSILDA